MTDIGTVWRIISSRKLIGFDQWSLAVETGLHLVGLPISPARRSHPPSTPTTVSCAQFESDRRCGRGSTPPPTPPELAGTSQHARKR